MKASYALEVENISVSYGGLMAVYGLSLKLKHGEIRGLIGPNGAGKSTVIDAISGRRPTDSGKVILEGQDISKLNVVQRRRRGMTRSFQRSSIFPALRVRDQIELAASKIGGCNPAEVLRELGLESFQDKMANEIGYGDQRRLDLALGFLGRPTVLLLDEPTAGLSMKESRNLAGHLQKMSRQWGVSMLLVEHDMEIVFGISDAITVLEGGRLLAEGEPLTVRANPRVQSAYLGSAA